jgi:hypothetical protein
MVRVATRSLRKGGPKVTLSLSEADAGHLLPHYYVDANGQSFERAAYHHWRRSRLFAVATGLGRHRWSDDEDDIDSSTESSSAAAIDSLALMVVDGRPVRFISGDLPVDDDASLRAEIEHYRASGHVPRALMQRSKRQRLRELWFRRQQLQHASPAASHPAGVAG